MFAISDGDDKDKEANKEDETIKSVVKKEYQNTTSPMNYEFIKNKIKSAKTVEELETHWKAVLTNRGNFTHEHFNDLKIATRDVKLAIK